MPIDDLHLLTLNGRVNRKGTDSPTGILQWLNDDNTAVVLWGVSDGIEYTETIPIEELKSADSQEKQRM